MSETDSQRLRHSTTKSESSQSSETDDSVCSSDSSTVHLPPAPDGGWGWVIVLAAFVISLICDGCAFSFGVMYTELLNYFSESKSKTSWVGSLFAGVPLILGPFSSALTTRFGCRKMTIAGGLISVGGFIASSFASSIDMLCITFGLVAGAGMSLCYVTSVVIVAFYFEKKRALATGLSVCGSGIGTFIFAPFTEFLIDEYGWRGTMLILGAIVSNVLVCGALFRPLEFSPEEKRRRALEAFDKISHTISRQSLPSRGRSRVGSESSDSDSSSNVEEVEQNVQLEQISHSQVQLPTYVNTRQKTEIPPEILTKFRRNGSTIEQTLQRYFHSLNFTNTEEPLNKAELLTVTSDDQIVFMSVNGINNKFKDGHEAKHKKGGVWQRKPLLKQKTKITQYLPLYRKDIFYRGNLLKLSVSQYQSSSCPELYTSSMDEDDESDIFDWCPIFKILHMSKQVKRVIKTMFDLKILGHPLFFLFAVSNFILYFWYDVPYVFMADRAVESGIPENRAPLIISVIGIINTVGQILYGYIGDKNINLNLLYGVSCMLAGLSVLLVPLFVSFWQMCLMGAFFGCFISSNYALSTVILVEYVGIDKLTNAYGLIMLIQGLANLIGPPVAGWMSDITGNYDCTFYAAGSFIILAGAMLFLMPLLKLLMHWWRALKYQDDIILQNGCKRVHIQESKFVVVEIESVV